MRLIMRARPAVPPATVPARAGVLIAGAAAAEGVGEVEVEGGGIWVVMMVPWTVVTIVMSFGCDVGIACLLSDGTTAAAVGWSVPADDGCPWAGFEGDDSAGVDGAEDEDDSTGVADCNVEVANVVELDAVLLSLVAASVDVTSEVLLDTDVEVLASWLVDLAVEVAAALVLTLLEYPGTAWNQKSSSPSTLLGQYG
jgi:hypothetical protein